VVIADAVRASDAVARRRFRLIAPAANTR